MMRGVTRAAHRAEHRAAPLLRGQLVPALVVLLLAGPLALVPVSGAADAAGSGVRSVRLDGVAVRLHERTRQVVTVRRTSGYHARVTLWSYAGSRWRATTRTTDGRVGYGGLSWPSSRRQGDGSTPRGSFFLPSSFGTRARLWNWRTPYRRSVANDYWVLDNSSRYYNRYRNRADGGFRWWLTSGPDVSEKLSDYRSQYEMAVVIGFNTEQVRRRGGAIFLHVNGRGATAGCVSVPRSTMKALMAALDPDQVPVIGIGA